jgi:peptide deformylase
MIQPLVTIPNPLLRKKSIRVSTVDDRIKQLAEDMIETTLDWDHDSELGAALAAVQIGETIRLTVIRNNFENAEDNTFLTFINPEIVQKSRDFVLDVEGCLSVPGYYARIPRANKIKVKAETLDGDEVRMTLEGFPARVFQHEIDHMHGKLFIDMISGADNLLRLDKDGQLHDVDTMPEEIRNALAHHSHDHHA